MKSLTYPLKQVEVISKTAEKLNKEDVEKISCPAGCLLSVEERLDAAYAKVKEVR